MKSKNKERTGNIVEVASALALGGIVILAVKNWPDDNVSVYSIEQRGSSQTRPVELIRREYIFRDSDNNPGMDNVFVFEDVVGSTSLSTEHHYDSYGINGKEIHNLYFRVQEAERNNNEVIREWKATYNRRF